MGKTTKRRARSLPAGTAAQMVVRSLVHQLWSRSNGAVALSTGQTRPSAGSHHDFSYDGTDYDPLDYPGASHDRSREVVQSQWVTFRSILSGIGLG